VLKGLFTVTEDKSNLSLDESVVALKEISNEINLNRMNVNDKAFLTELILIIDEMEIPLLINEGEA
jgi:hypothetical protein